MPQRQTYTRKSSYTSHPRLSLDEYTSIGKNSFDEIPKTISVKGVDVVIQDESGFLFPISVAENPGKEWTYQPRSGWYTHVKTGLKVRLHNSATPDYHKPNGCGSAKTELEVIIP